MRIKINKNCVCENKNIPNKKNSIFIKNLPITEIFTSRYKKSKKFQMNQQIIFCNKCQHMSLMRFVDPKLIYNKNYLTSSTSSFSARYSNDIFHNFILKNINQREKYSKILEIGTNDLYLLKKFQRNAKKLVGIDPVIKDDKKFKNFHPIKNFFTNVDNKRIGLDSDIIISGHTLEHVENPEMFIKKIISLAHNKTKVFLQFPSVESLINNGSFDQVNHQHLNYFSLNSFDKLLKKCGGKIIKHEYHELHFGVLMVFFTIKNSKLKSKIDFKKNKKITSKDFIKSYKNFKKHLNAYKNLIEKYLFLKKKIYVIGAGLMLPIVNYHLDGIFEKVDSILDDDKSKQNKYFLNINKKITSLKKKNLENSICIISTISSAIVTRKLTNILESKKAQVILVPTLTF